jgi:multiple sugar transport system permease protein
MGKTSFFRNIFGYPGPVSWLKSLRGKGYLTLVPLLVILSLVEAYPLGYSVYLSLTDYASGNFVGGANYAQLLDLGYFGQAVLTSLAYALASAALALGIGVILAFQVSVLRRGKGILEAVLLAPLAAAPIFVGVIWAPSGVWDDVNTFWHFVLGQPFFNPASSFFFFPVMILSDAWEWAPLIMLVSLGIMATIPAEVYEAAEISGASRWQTLRRIGLPAILRSPVMQFVIVIRFVDAMRTFEIPFSWSTWVSLPTAGSPVDTVSLLLFKLFTLPLYGFPVGEISAMAIALLALTLGATTVLFSLLRRPK